MPAIKTPVRKKSRKKIVKVKTRQSGHEKTPSQRISHTHMAADMTDKEWQTSLRRQMAEKEKFTIRNLDHEPVYSDYRVSSHSSGNSYKVALRSRDNSLNFCSCPDFKTNQLGTCKHIEAVWLSVKRKRGFKQLLDKVPVLPYTSLYVSYLGARKVKLRIGTDRRKEWENWAKRYFDKDFALLPAAFAQIDQLLREAYHIDPSFRCYEDTLELIVTRRDLASRQALLEREGKGLLQDLVRVSLFPYQQEGILFAARCGRSILADDMGLGKTVQAIAWAVLMSRHWKTQKTVIICPTSLKYQWKAEISRFTDKSVSVIEGNYLARKELYEKDESYFKVVSYHMAGNDWSLINKMQPDIVILDEAQRIKNWKAKISQNIKRIGSPYALMLTGTPLENNIEELYSLVQYIDPFLLGSLHHFLTSHQIKDKGTGKVTGYRDLHAVGRQLSGILLRRTKKEVLKQLPARMDKNLFVPMTEAQAEMYDGYNDVVAKLVHKWKRFGFLNEQDRQRLLKCLNGMRMVCDSTYIIDQVSNHQTKLDELLNILDELLGIDGEKVVIFSQWERMTRLIARELERRKVAFQSLHGGVPGKKREALINNFNNDPDCKVFLSTDAGGVGLNLQSAANLINMDIPWNPAVLEQRIARIHRLGQKRNISVTNLVAQGTIEHRMLSVLQFKTSIAAGILDNGEDSIFLGTDRFDQFMQSVESITRDMPEEHTSFDPEEQAEIAARTVEAASQDIPVTPGDDDAISPSDLVRNGLIFFTQLLTTLQDPQAVKKLAATITEKDEKTGKTWLKLPVENEKTVENALNLLTGLFGQKNA